MAVHAPHRAGPNWHMTFFKTSEGRLHVGRLAGVLYFIGFLPAVFLDGLTAVNLMRLIYTAGWWLAFCEKQPALGTEELLKRPHRLVGMILVLSGLVGSFYVLARSWRA